MKRSVSVAHAKNNLPALVHATEEEGAIGIARRGETVAVIVSLRHYERLKSRSSASLLSQVTAIRQEHELDNLEEGEAPLSRMRGDEFARPAKWGR
jgi:prevent-host-death family protein